MTSPDLQQLVPTHTLPTHAEQHKQNIKVQLYPDVRRKPVRTYYTSKKKQNPKPPQKYPLIQLHFQTPRRTERGTWDDPGWQLKAEPCSCQFLQAAFVITQRRARGSAGHRAGGASCLPELQGSVGHSPANSPPTSGQGDSPCPQGF